jgi:hypothetical protein
MNGSPPPRPGLIKAVRLFLRWSRRDRARRRQHDVFVSYRRENGNPIALAETLNDKLFGDAVYVDVLDSEVESLDVPILRYPGPSPTNPSIPSSRSPERRRIALGRILGRRLREVEVVLLLFDKHYQEDFIAASERARLDPNDIDWVRYEIEAARDLGKSFIAVYGDEREVPGHERFILTVDRLNAYPELKAVVTTILNSESVLLEFGTAAQPRQERELAESLKNRLVTYHRAAARRARRMSAWSLSACLAALVLAGGTVLLASWLAYRYSYDDTLQEWLRRRQVYTKGFVTPFARFGPRYLKEENAQLDPRDDRWMNAWKSNILGLFKFNNRNKVLVVESQDDFEANFQTFSLRLRLADAISLQQGYAFLFDSRQPPPLRQYRPIPMMVYDKPSPLGSSLIVVHNPNLHDKLLLVLYCQGSATDLPSVEAQFIRTLKVEP